MDSQKNKRIKVLFVCLGNICRSPAAESTFNKQIKDLNLNDFLVCESRGTSSLHEGELPDPRTIKSGKARGLEFSTRSSPLKAQDFHEFDHILVMDESNYRNVLKLNPNPSHQQKVKLMMSFAPDLGYNEVPDPYYGGEKDFQLVLDLLDVACRNFIKSVIK
jgi:protein-tyrosine phosphatase